MTATTPTRRPVQADRHGERGTALVLAPVLVLVLAVLGAIAVDLTVLHTAQRTLHRVAASAADDAAGLVDQRRLQVEGVVVIDPVAARRFVTQRLSTADLPGRLDGVRVDVTADRVVVRATMTVDEVLLRAVPGRPRSRPVGVTVAGRLLR